MAELNVSTHQDKEDPTMEPQMGKLGIYIHTDRDYFQRKDEVRDYFELDEEDMKKLNISPVRQVWLKKTYQALSFTNSQGAAGQGGDSGKFYKAMTAVRNLCQRNIEDLTQSSAADDEVTLVCTDRLAKVEQIVQATFRKDNTTIQKAFTHIGTMPANYNNTPQPRESSASDLGRIAAEQRAKRQHIATTEPPATG